MIIQVELRKKKRNIVHGVRLDYCYLLSINNQLLANYLAFSIQYDLFFLVISFFKHGELRRSVQKQLCENFDFSSGLTEKPFLCANPGETTHSTGKLCPIACTRTNSSHYNHMPFPSAFRAEVLLSVVNPLEGMRRGQRRNSHPFTTSVIARDGAG